MSIASTAIGSRPSISTTSAAPCVSACSQARSFATMTRRLLDESRDFESLTLADWQQYSDLFQADVIGRVTATASVAARRTPQSTHPVAVAAALQDLKRFIADARQRGR